MTSFANPSECATLSSKAGIHDLPKAMRQRKCARHLLQDYHFSSYRHAAPHYRIGPSPEALLEPSGPRSSEPTLLWARPLGSQSERSPMRPKSISANPSGKAKRICAGPHSCRTAALERTQYARYGSSDRTTGERPCEVKSSSVRPCLALPLAVTRLWNKVPSEQVQERVQPFSQVVMWSQVLREALLQICSIARPTRASATTQVFHSNQLSAQALLTSNPKVLFTQRLFAF